MPAIASLEDLKIGQRDFRSMFFNCFTLRLTLYALRSKVRCALCAMRFARSW